MKNKNINIFYVGYYGYDNFGDEALLYSTRLIIDRACGEYDLDIDHVILDTYYHTGFLSVNRWKMLSIIKAVKNADIIVFGGGGIFQDRTSSLSLYYYLAIVAIAKFFKKKIVMIGQGLVSINGLYNKFLCKKILRDIPMTVRDHLSYNFVKEFNKNCILSSDLLFNYSYSVTEECNHKKSIFFNVRRWDDYGEQKAILQVGRSLFERDDRDVIALSLNRIDKKSLEIISEKIGYKYSEFINIEKSPKEFQREYRSDSILIGMRLHSLILATCYGIPFIAISNDRKLEEFAKETGQLYFKPSDSIGIIDGIKNIEQEYEKYSENILTSCSDMIERAYLNEKIIDDQINLWRDK